MGIGKLRHRLTIQYRSDTKNATTGRRIPAWSNVAAVPTVWCRVEPISATESFQASQKRSTISHRITLRGRTDLTAAMRLTGTMHSATRIFEIVGIRRLPDEGASQWLQLDCLEDPGTGA